MGSCIICGADVDGWVCDSHEEDVCFDFTGSRPGELVPGRYYRGSVDGFAEFGVFIDIGDHVTGLLHTSELDRRLESLDWDPGDEVFVQVKNVRDNGNVDLGWSIRQHVSEFRGRLIQSPEGDERPDEEADADADATGAGGSDATKPADPAESPAPETGEAGGVDAGGATPTDADADTDADATRGVDAATEAGGGTGAATDVDTDSDADADTDTDTDTDTDLDAGADVEPAPTTGESPDDPSAGTAAMEAPLKRTAIDALDDHVGDPVRIEGTIIDARQTSGPTVFEVRDESGTVDCAAFESAGVRAYPDVAAGDVVRLDGVVEERRGSIQVETESLSAIAGEEREAVERRLEAAIEERARPDDVEPLGGHPGVEAVLDDVVAAATALRRAVFESRPVVIRHNATVDGYVAGAALERALLPLVRAEHEEHEAEYHYVDRRPLDGRIYGMGDAVRDATSMLDARERHDESVPLFAFVNAGSTEESRDGFELLSLYDAPLVTIDGNYPDASMADAADAFVSPHLDDATGEAVEDVSTATLAAAVAAHVNPAVRADLRHLPAVSYWRELPATYADLSAAAGYDAEAVATLREAIALEAFYQAYEDKRELVDDLLFGDGALADHASEQFRERVGTEVRTARSHLERHTIDGVALAVLDLDAYTHPYDFPPPPVLLSELADEAGDVDALLGVDEDTLLVWSERPVDMRTVGERADEAVPQGGVETRSGRDGTLVFLSGERDAVVDAAVEAVADQLR